ncbi:ATP-dependent RNA helicase HrpA [Marinitenerispora sediminis]|uniref:RNA helicase n=1 Tax=Marinitenerispora sediminis TaxID=1931232 RepID=A0A368T7X0_9ACTN|nr:ATP-dependent RNA helicase HrpA [Marinitenerispora sediminis]RCV51954.1 ATP-dependent RNA helicase HrpA [Marinitenerispora sediminis]RCV55396.1 ATP-dependent RNA helicase HrpA [Marinitenerispora sediminis]RCV58201.1 ATP-dependent RNA helicase HrpA [Marinitenerispora sediminis]
MRTPPVPPSPLAELRERLTELMPSDRRRLRRRIDGLQKIRDSRKREAVLAAISADADTAAQRVRRRRAAVPEISYPAELPVSQKKDDILAAIRDHQVVIVAGETGSGKTTQLPKICLELGRGVLGTIGHTQPRRLAARTVAERIADELGTRIGETVGYKVRFTDQAGEDTLVKLMTDGILLAEMQQDRLLSQYDTLIIDEAHERSLNIDFLLGYVKQLLPRRPDLKVIITSATIDPERFSRHFGNAPIVEVSGRTYPVEVRYRPITGDADPEDPDRDQTQAVCDAVEELRAEGPGDILVFLSGEREIRDTAEALEKLKLPGTEVLPLFARLSAAEQHRVFAPHRGRRIVLATNVAETSLTVPGIKYVVDPGTARISRYSHRTKVQRLPIEAVSQASANQRKGRCGRVSEGICIRLYSEEDFLSRPEFTDPEILRTNLASVILQMAALGLGDIADFPFVEGPDRRQVKDGVLLLHELGAIDPDEPDPRRRLTPLGRRLAQLPVDPRLGRMVLEAGDNGCVREVMVIAAALSIQDPRERPVDKQQAAAEKHARFAEKESDFLAYLNLWSHLQERQRELSSSQFRRMCRAEFLNYLRVREWQDIYGQLRQVVKTLGITVNSAPADPQKVHVSLLSGLLSHVGLKDPDKHEYLGARGARFAIFPGSGLFKKQPRWVMAAELVETSRLWGRMAARIEPEWAENLAGHLVKRTYSEPHWEKNQGAVMAYEKVTLYGVPLVAQRKVNYGRIDPRLSRELFIRHALVEGDWHTHHAFFHANRRLLEEVEDLEHRARRRDILVDDETLFDFYDQRLGEECVSARHFDSWWKRARRDQPELLNFEKSMLINDRAGDVSEDDYPDVWRQGEHGFPLTYQFEPGTDADGVTAHIPLKVLNQVEGDGFDWQIPGLREELVTALIRSLPKPIRTSFVPVPDHARAVLARLRPHEEPLLDALGRELGRTAGIRIPADAWQLDRVPDHLKITFRAVDDRGRTLAEAKDLDELRRALKPKLQAAISAEAKGIERTGLTSWDFGPLRQRFERKTAGHSVRGYPALVDEGDTVAVRIFDTEAEQRRAMWAGTRRLLLLRIPSPVPVVRRGLENRTKLALSDSPHGSVPALFDDCLTCAVDALVADAGGPVWDPDAFDALADQVRAELADTLAEVVAAVERVLVLWQQVQRRIRGTTSLAVLPSLNDVQGQLAELVFPGFVTATGRRRLPDLARYLRAIAHRLDKLPENPRRDQTNLVKVAQSRAAYDKALADLPPGRAADADVREVRWMLEELRVSYFAQELGTAYPVSDKRITKALQKLTG